MLGITELVANDKYKHYFKEMLSLLLFVYFIMVYKYFIGLANKLNTLENEYT